MVWQTVGPSALSGRRPPEWIGTLLVRRLARLAQLEPNWDTYGAPAISASAIQFAKELAHVFSRAVPDLTAPQVVPMSTGGVELEWLAGEHFASVEVDPVRNSWCVAYSTPDFEGEEVEPGDAQPFLNALRQIVAAR